MKGNNNISTCSEAEVVGIGPVGGPSGDKWEFIKPEGAIKQIIIRHAIIVDSVAFVTENGHHSAKFGGGGGWTTDSVDITSPGEYLTGVSGTFGTFEGWEVIKSLQLQTNKSSYGPFGRGGGVPFSLPVLNGSSFVGFHGRSGVYLVGIGIYVRPPSTPVLPKPITFNMPSNDAMDDWTPRNPGPFGGPFGREWNDGLFPGINQILVHVDDLVGAIQGVRFEYAGPGKGENGSVWSPRHGNASNVMHKICIDHQKEFLMGISGYYSSVEENGRMETIRSISFLTNKGVYGPFG